jgi:hypothetical protein
MKSIILVLAMVGIILLAVGYVKSNLQCPPPKIEYRYITKDFEDQQNTDNTNILSVTGMYNMFENDSPWVQTNSYATTDIKYPA